MTDEQVEVEPQKFDKVKCVNTTMEGSVTTLSIPPALISLPYPLPMDKVWRIIRQMAAKYLSNTASLALFVSNSTFDGYSADVDFYVVTRNSAPQQTGGRQLYDG